jgi:hypothetical protein
MAANSRVSTISISIVLMPRSTAASVGVRPFANSWRACRSRGVMCSVRPGSATPTSDGRCPQNGSARLRRCSTGHAPVARPHLVICSMFCLGGMASAERPAFPCAVAERLPVAGERPAAAPASACIRHAVPSDGCGARSTGAKLHIGASILCPDRTTALDTKHRLGAFPESASC